MAERHAGLRIVENAVQRNLDGFAARYIKKYTMSPQRGVQCGELAFAGLDCFGHRMGANEIGVLADSSIQVGEDNPLLTHRLVQFIMDGLAIDGGNESALLIANQR